MIKQLCRGLPERTLVIVADGTYAVLEVLGAVTQLSKVMMVTRLRLDACLYDRAPERTAHTKGRPALKGKAQLKLQARLCDAATVWQKHSVAWDGGISREVEIATGTALWYQSARPPVAIRWVLVRDPAGKFEPQALLCSDQGTNAVQILA